MKKSLVLIIYFSVNLSSFAQNKFNEFIKLFPKNSYDTCFDHPNYNLKIDYTYDTTYLNPLFPENRDLLPGYNLFPLGILYNGNNITVLIEQNITADFGSSNFYLITFNPKGNIIDYQKIGASRYDYDQGHLFKCCLKSSNKLLVTEEKYYIEGDIKIVEFKKYHLFEIGDTGFKEIDQKYLFSARRYPQASDKIISLEELRNLTKNELDIMRNEIFASHGYIFKTEKWKHYFENQIWYEPKYKNVNSMITPIEKENIQNILNESNEK